MNMDIFWKPLFCLLHQLSQKCIIWGDSRALFAFSYCSWGSCGKNTEVGCHSLLQWTMFCQNSTMTCLSWVALHSMAHSFIELHKPPCHDEAVIHEWDTQIGHRFSQPLE